MNGRGVQGRGIKAGYWAANPLGPDEVTLAIGCDKNAEWWATVRLTRADLEQMLREMDEVKAGLAQPLPEIGVGEIPW